MDRWGDTQDREGGNQLRNQETAVWWKPGRGNSQKEQAINKTECSGEIK